MGIPASVFAGRGSSGERAVKVPRQKEERGKHRLLDVYVIKTTSDCRGETLRGGDLFIDWDVVSMILVGKKKHKSTGLQERPRNHADLRAEIHIDAHRSPTLFIVLNKRGRRPRYAH